MYYRVGIFDAFFNEKTCSSICEHFKLR
jgi:hypothetical protein